MGFAINQNNIETASPQPVACSNKQPFKADKQFYQIISFLVEYFVVDTVQQKRISYFEPLFLKIVCKLLETEALPGRTAWPVRSNIK